MSKEKVQETKVSIGVGTVVKLKSDSKSASGLTVIGMDAFKGLITVIWRTDNGNIGKAEIPAMAVNVIKS